MIIKKPKLALLFILGIMLTTFVAISCNNNSSDKKEPATPENKVDSSKMDSASTRPVKTTD
jgi:hypothetical protein